MGVLPTILIMLSLMALLSIIYLLKRYGQFISNYISWAINPTALRENNINPMKGIDTSWYSQFVDNSKKIHWSKKEFIELLESLSNAQDQAFLALLFEGVMGASQGELVNITYDDMHGFNKDYLINPHHSMVAKGEYPDTLKLIERTDKYKNMISLNQNQIKLWLQLFKSINQTLNVLKERYKVITLTFPESSEEVIIEMKNHGIKMNLPCTRNSTKQHEGISFSVEMRDALEAYFKLNSEKLNMWFAGTHRPFILDDEKQVKTLILPVRTY